MYDNRHSPGNSSPSSTENYVMTNDEIERFRQGLQRVENGIRNSLTDQFNISSTVEMTPRGQQGVLHIVTPFQQRVNFTVAPKTEMFSENDPVIPQNEAGELSEELVATLVNSLFEQIEMGEAPAG